MEDGEVREDGVAGRNKQYFIFLYHTYRYSTFTDKRVNIPISVSAVAQQILWNCLIEDPALVLRHFLEKLTVSNRQVQLATFRIWRDGCQALVLLRGEFSQINGTCDLTFMCW